MTDLFNLDEGIRLKEEGMALAADNSNILPYAQNLATLYAENHVGRCTADDVMRQLTAEQIKRLGNAAGSLFKGKQWTPAGIWVQSQRKTNHGRWIRVWRLK
jgi:hypothetical protein